VGDLTGKGLTLQGGFQESYSTTVRPYTYNGCKVTDLELACQIDGLLKMNIGSIDGWNWTSATGLAAASYLSSLEEFNWAQLTCTIGGTPTTSSGRTTVAGGTAIKGLRGVSLKLSNKMRTDRRVAGGAGIKVEQVENDFRMVTGDWTPSSPTAPNSPTSSTATHPPACSSPGPVSPTTGRATSR
jgi:hypothetical protein